MSDSDETLPPEDDRPDSPDLFDDPSEVQRKDKGKSGADIAKQRTPVKRYNSKAHEISDSESDSDNNVQHGQNKGVYKTSPKKGSNSYRNNNGDNCGSNRSDWIKSPQKGRADKDKCTGDKSDKKKFMDDFLNMTDSESDDDYIVTKRKLLEMKQKALKEKAKSPKQASPSSTERSTVNTRLEQSNHFLQKEHKKDYSKPFKTEESGQKKSIDSDSYSQKRRSKEGQSSTPTSSLKRKHSQSPVPQELHRAVTDILNEHASSGSSVSRKKVPCQYGRNCYRKNPSHFEEFSHPSDNDPVPANKRPKLDTSASNEKSRTHSPLSSKVRSESPTGSKVKGRPEVKPVTTSNMKVKTDSRSEVRPATPSNSNGKSDKPSSKVKTHSPTSDCKVTQRSGLLNRNPRTIEEKLKLAEPYSFFLTKVTGISDKYNATYAMDIKDLLSDGMGNLTASCQFNFMFDIQWLMKQYPPQFRSKPLLIVHGEQGASMTKLQSQALSYNNIRFCQAKLEMMYGTHHTKMMLLLYEEGLRVVIHTSNLIEQDWYQKTQGMWISPMFPRLQEASKDKGDSVTHFKRDLIDYMQAYKAYQLKDWIDHVARHDMSLARVVIIGSVPGRHVDRAKSMWGHLKVRKVLQEHGPSQATVKVWPVIGQFSSIGSMGPNKENWLCGEWQQSLATAKLGSGPQSNTRLQLIFPSRHNVRLCLEGYPAGGSIPYTAKTAQKQQYLHNFFHVWKSEGRGRSRAMPHIKSYARPMQDGSKAAWFIVTSANLSKAAWGALEKKGVQLMIRSYEIGVMFLPKFFDEGEIFPITSDPDSAAATNKLLLPYDLPPTLYDKKDRPWMWDIPYMDLPDTNGNVWCPFSK